MGGGGALLYVWVRYGRAFVAGVGRWTGKWVSVGVYTINSTGFHDIIAEHCTVVVYVKWAKLHGVYDGMIGGEKNIYRFCFPLYS